MAKFYTALMCLVLASVLLTSATVYGITPQELQNQIKVLIGQEGLDKVNQVVGGNFSSIDDIQMRFAVNSTNVSSFWISQYNNLSLVPIVINGTVVNGTHTPPPVKVEICGNGLDDDGDGLVDEGCQVTPPNQPDKPGTDVNETATLRVVAVGDVDANSGLTKQLDLAVKYHAKIFILIGDYGYTDCQKVIDNIKAHGFTKDNAVIIQGNHDCSTTTKAFNGWNQLYGNTNFPGVSQLSVFAIDGNQGFGCTSTQFTDMKDKLSSSDAWYNLPAIHQPFATVKNNHHGPNGQFDCWNPLFKANGVDTVLQAHVHNYQRIGVNGIDYEVVGTGTHDTGSSMYSIDSNSWNGFPCQKCFTGTNGILVMDFKIDDPAQRQMFAWFVANDETVKDKFQ